MSENNFLLLGSISLGVLLAGLFFKIGFLIVAGVILGTANVFAYFFSWFRFKK